MASVTYEPSADHYTIADTKTHARDGALETVYWFRREIRKGIAKGYRPEMPTHNDMWIRVKMVRR